MLATSVDLRYPRMEVIGLNLAGEIPLGWIHEDVLPLGYRFEGGVYLPQRTEIRLEQEEIVVSGLTQPAGEYDYDMDGNPETKGRRPTVVPSTPFAKWVLALDYTFGRHLMTSVMWVHGLVDEYGAGDWTKPGWAVTKSWAEGDPEDPDDLTTCVTLDQLGMGSCPYEKYAVEITRPRIGDYVVLLLNLTLVDDRLLLRLFTLWDVRGVWEERWVADPDKPARTDWRDWTGRRVRKHHGMFTKKGYSGLIYPEINYNFGDGFDLGAGALFQLGNSYTKFGDPAASGSLVWTRVRYQY